MIAFPTNTDGGGISPRIVSPLLAILTTGLFFASVFYLTYIYPWEAGVLIEPFLVLCLLGFLASFIWMVVRWVTILRSSHRAHRLTSSTMLVGLLLAVSSYFNEGAACVPFANTTGVQPWRHAEFAVRTAAGPFGLDVPALVLDATVKGFCPKLLALPHLVGGVLLIAVAAVADRRLRTRTA